MDPLFIFWIGFAAGAGSFYLMVYRPSMKLKDDYVARVEKRCGKH